MPASVNVIARRSSYHGNTLGALDLSGKEPLRKPYTPWLGRFLHAPRAYEYRCENPSHPEGCGDWHAAELQRMIDSYGADTVAAFIAEPVERGDPRRRRSLRGLLGEGRPRSADAHGVLVIADEVMTGFGRTGRWFGADHWDARPDIVTAGKGTTSGYVPFGFAACTGEVYDAVASKGFVHGFTWSHNALGAAVALATLRRLGEGLVERARDVGAKLQGDLAATLAEHPHVGEVRGLGMLIGVELVGRPRHEGAVRSAAAGHGAGARRRQGRGAAPVLVHGPRRRARRRPDRCSDRRSS